MSASPGIFDREGAHIGPTAPKISVSCSSLVAKLRSGSVSYVSCSLAKARNVTHCQRKPRTSGKRHGGRVAKGVSSTWSLALRFPAPVQAALLPVQERRTGAHLVSDLLRVRDEGLGDGGVRHGFRGVGWGELGGARDGDGDGSEGVSWSRTVELYGSKSTMMSSSRATGLLSSDREAVTRRCTRTC